MTVLWSCQRYTIIAPHIDSTTFWQCFNKTLPKAQRTRGLSSAYQSNFSKSYHKFFRSYHKFLNKSWSDIFRILTKNQLQNLDQTLKPCAQSMNKNLTLWPNFTFQICTKLLSARFSSSTWVTVTTSTSFELSSSHQSSLLNSSEWVTQLVTSIPNDRTRVR